MIAQYVAASLVAENKVLAHPASVDSIPTSAGQEDHVSMGATAAVHLWHVCANVERVLGIELLCGAQGARLPGTAATRAGRRRARTPRCASSLRISTPTARSRARSRRSRRRIRDGSLLAAVEAGSAPLRE